MYRRCGCGVVTSQSGPGSRNAQGDHGDLWLSGFWILNIERYGEIKIIFRFQLSTDKNNNNPSRDRGEVEEDFANGLMIKCFDSLLLFIESLMQ